MKFYGKVGYATSVETRPGVWQDQIIEQAYFGDVIRNSRRLENGDKVNDDLSVGNSISIVADAYANEHFHEMRYITWSGSFWVIQNVDVEAPRLVLRLGGVYNGPRAAVAAP